VLFHLVYFQNLFRIAANEKHYLSSIMQIRDLRHKRRLIIKATDVVLFGPPQSKFAFFGLSTKSLF
jgi:hypothetical protein